MQFAFAYFYYLINERKRDPWPSSFHLLIDTDRNGRLNKNEFRTVWSFIHDTPFEEDKLVRQNRLVNEYLIFFFEGVFVSKNNSK